MIGVRNCVAQLLLRLPFQLGSSRELPVAGKWIHRLSHRLLPSGEKVWSRVRPSPAKRIWPEVNPRTGHDYIQGLTEAATQRRVVEYLKPGMVFYDLGANIGLFSLLAARIVGPSGNVFSFEPDFETARRLRRNVERNKFSNITVVEAGAWSSTGRANFVAVASSSPDRDLGRFTLDAEFAAGTSLACYALDDFVRTASPPDAIRCDVEGAELEVFRGAERTIAVCRPWIMCEIHSAANRDGILEFYRRFGYKTQIVDDNHLLGVP